MSEPRSVTELLVDWSNGDPAALEELTPYVYRELHGLARSALARQRGQQSLQPTVLIDELYLRLIHQTPAIHWEHRSHFLGIAARIMRAVLVDHARSRFAGKRGGGAAPVTLNETVALAPDHRTLDVLQLDAALQRLSELDARKARLIELRYFAGMTGDEIASACCISLATVKRELRLSEAWLRRDLASDTRR